MIEGLCAEPLEEIRVGCNSRYGELVPETNKYKTLGYTPEFVVASFAADAENSILLGADPASKYSGFQGVQPTELRERAVGILENLVDFYLK